MTQMIEKAGNLYGQIEGCCQASAVEAAIKE